MFFVNLSLAEIGMIFGALSAFTVTLYLLSRARKQQRVATLRFWVSSQDAARQVHRRRIDQPWSLLLQLLAILLLVLAVSQPRWGDRDGGARDHVLLIDTSSWMAARTGQGQNTLSIDARREALRWLRALPVQDRVMVVRADSLATPVTRFESKRDVLEPAIRESTPGQSALLLEQALEFARHALRVQARRAGEIVYAGAGRVVSAGEAPGAPAAPKGPPLRLLLTEKPVENVGLTRVSLSRAPTEANLWEVNVSARNYGSQFRRIPVAAAFGGAVMANRSLELNAGQEVSVTLPLRTQAAGWVEVRLFTKDALSQDDRAQLEIPEQKPLRVIAYSDDAEALRPVLEADARIETRFAATAAYRADADADVVILDRFRPPQAPKVNSIWIEPPQNGSPVPVSKVAEQVALSRWRNDNPLGAGLRTKDLKLGSALVFRPAAGDISVAETADGPVVVARAAAGGNQPKLVVIGFHPMRSNMRFELATPLLFANCLHWMAPDALRTRNVQATSVGSIRVPIAAKTNPDTVRVLSDSDTPIPFTLHESEVRFFTPRASTVRVLTPEREQVYSLTLPQVADSVWQPPAQALRGLRSMSGAPPLAKELWAWLATAGGLLLLIEWLLYGRQRNARSVPTLPRRPFELRRAS